MHTLVSLKYSFYIFILQRFSLELNTHTHTHIHTHTEKKGEWQELSAD